MSYMDFHLSVQSVWQHGEDEAAACQQAVDYQQKEFSLQLDGTEHPLLHREVFLCEYIKTHI